MSGDERTTRDRHFLTSEVDKHQYHIWRFFDYIRISYPALFSGISAPGYCPYMKT
jgi:hypothetical protein